MSKVGARALRNARNPEPLPVHRRLVRNAYAKSATGWCTGDMASLNAYGFFALVASRVNPDEVYTSILFSRDRMHHSVGWWRNAEYEYCYHLSLAAFDATDVRLVRAGLKMQSEAREEQVVKAEENYWGRLFFGDDADKVWHEPGGTDPSYSPVEKARHSRKVHLRLFLDPETFEPFIPTGEVYDLTRWLPITPEKVDRV